MGLFVLTLAGVVGKQLGSELFKPNKAEVLNKLVIDAAAKLNSQAPKKLDEITILTRAEAIDGKVLAIHYKLDKFRTYEKQFDFQTAKSVVVKSTCKTQEGKTDTVLHRGMSFRFIYTADDGREIGRFDVARKDCPYLP